MPPGSEDSYESVARYVREREPDPYHRIKALHDWLADRIAYDAEALADNKIPSQDARSVFASKKSVCAGYANLLNAMAKITGDEVEVVVGDARRDVDEVGGLGHAWNAVKIDGKWFLLDATWDAGHVSGRTFTKQYNTNYLFTPPEVFGIDHFPDSERWQLRDRPLTRGDFMRQPMLEAEFFARGLRLEAPDRSQVTVSGPLQIRLDNPRGQFMLASFLPKGVTSGERTRCEVRPGPRIDVSCSFPGDGVFRVLLFAGAERFGSYEHVGTIEAVHRG
jgi:transglutaminase/protease-like cytokinesis protein 3